MFSTQVTWWVCINQWGIGAALTVFLVLITFSNLSSILLITHPEGLFRSPLLRPPCKAPRVKSTTTQERHAGGSFLQYRKNVASRTGTSGDGRWYSAEIWAIHVYSRQYILSFNQTKVFRFDFLYIEVYRLQSSIVIPSRRVNLHRGRPQHDASKQSRPFLLQI